MARAWQDAHHTYVAIQRMDGLGAQLQARATCILQGALVRNTTYLHDPFRHLGHSVDETAAERWFNLGEGHMRMADAPANVTVQHTRGCQCFADSNNQAWPLLSSALLARYHSPHATPKPRTYARYRHDAVNIAVHLRRGDVRNCSEESREELGRQAEAEWGGMSLERIPESCNATSPRGVRCVSTNHTVNTVMDVVAKISSMSQRMRINVVVFTETVEGQRDDFVAGVFRRAFSVALVHDVHVVMGGDALESFHAMVLSDVFVMGHSSFSFMPALYKHSDQVVVYDPFWSLPSPHWLVARSHGHLSRQQGPPGWWQAATWQHMLRLVEQRKLQG